MNRSPLVFMRTGIRHYQPILLRVIDQTYHTIPALLAVFGPGDALYEKSGANSDDRPPHPPANG